MTSYSKPTPQQIDKAVALLASPQHCRVFFGKLENPEWIEPLREKGCFKHPPEPVESEGGVSHPAWPASHYLARMASKAPQEVLAALEGIETPNARVISDICDAALAMPGELAEALSNKILQAVKARVWLQLYADKVADLASKLARDGRTEAALSLADALFILKPHKSIGYEPIGIIDPYRYGQLLAKVSQALLEADGPRAMEWACALLLKAASFHVSPDARNDFDDVSSVWRPMVEGQRREHPHDLADSIVTSTCGVAEGVVRGGAWPVAKAVEYIEGLGKLILSRIALHLVRVFGDMDIPLARRRILERELFEDYRYRHEYAMLLKDRFGILAQDEQATVLGWIDQGPDKEDTRRILKANLGDDFREEYVERRTKAWQRDRLSWFRDSLPPDWRERYEALVAEVGPAEHADVTFWCETSWGGGEPPKTAKQLGAMDTASIVEFLGSWRPDPKDVMGPSVADLANQFGAAVRENLERFSAEAPAFAVLHPTYVTRLLGEIATALQNKREVAFDPVTELCLAVAAKPMALSPEDSMPGDPLDSDQSWEYARNEVATVVARLCDQDSPLHLQDKLWQCLAALEDSPDKSYIVGEPEEDVRVTTWLDHACNNPKARWVHAVIRYAIWAKRQAVRESGAEEDSVGMAQIPGAADVLTKLLDPQDSSSPAIRSEYGQSFPAMCWLDREWAEDHAADVFSMDGDHVQHGWAAWNSYLVANRAYDEVFRILEGVYSHAVDSLERPLQATGARFNPLESLAEHLIVLCGRGVVQIDEPDSLLSRFLRNAPAEASAHAIETVGRSLKGEGDIPEDVVQRFVRLWEWFWANMVEGQEEPAKEALSRFGWWLACGRFNDSWCLDQTVRITELQPVLSPESDTMEKLSMLAAARPSKAIMCADRMVRSDQEGWRLHGWRDALTRLLQEVLASGDASARVTATSLIEHLGRRGFLEFGKLLGGQHTASGPS